MASKFNLNRIIKDAGKAGEEESTGSTPIEPIKNEPVHVIVTGTASTIGGIKNRVFEFMKNHQVDFKYLLLVIPIIAIFILARAVQNNQSIKSKAGSYTANISFQLSNSSLPPETTYGVWLNTNAPAGFVSAEVDFNPTLVKMTKEVALTNSLFTKIVKLTSMTEANTTGKIYIILGLDPTKLTTPPSSTFQIANLTFNALTTNPNVTTAVTFNTGGMQIVATDQSVFTLSAINLTLTLNPTATPLATPSATISPAPKPTTAPSCSKCFKKACDDICEKGDSKTLCPDCL